MVVGVAVAVVVVLAAVVVVTGTVVVGGGAVVVVVVPWSIVGNGELPRLVAVALAVVVVAPD